MQNGVYRCFGQCVANAGFGGKPIKDAKLTFGDGALVRTEIITDGHVVGRLYGDETTRFRLLRTTFERHFSRVGGGGPVVKGAKS